MGGAVFSFLILLAGFGAFLVVFPNSPLPEEWNPRLPLKVSAPVTPVTRWKLAAALSDNAACAAALEQAAQFRSLPDFVESDQCHIRPQVALREVVGVRMTEVNTRCQVALRTVMWMQHGIIPAADAHFGARVTRLHHLSSYNCREIRTTSGIARRMSTHATGDALDVTGVTLANGRRISLIDGWDGPDPAIRAFLRDMRDSACTWFRTTLGPDYNSLHADHFHLQHTGWGTCR